MRLVSFGELAIEYYLKNNVLTHVCGSGYGANILSNLSDVFDTSFIGFVGSDIQGKIATNSLKKLNVDVNDVSIVDMKTKQIFNLKNKYTDICPYCNRLYKSDYIIDADYIIKNIKEDDYLIFDNVEEYSIYILNKVNNKSFLFLEGLDELEYMSLDEIIDLLSNHFEIIYMSKEVYENISYKFKVDSTDIYNYLNPKILIINKNNHGVDLIYNGIFEHKDVEKINKVDKSGSSEAFFSVFIKDYINNEVVDEKSISKTFIDSLSLMNYLYLINSTRKQKDSIYKIKNYKECICSYIETTDDISV